MKSALLFPGLDALFVPSKFKQWMLVPQVAAAVDEASAYLSEFTHAPEDLRALLLNHRVPHMTDFDRATVALTGVQVGIARCLEQSLQWDYVVGCSHGDIARSVICDAVSFREAVAVVWAFAQMRNSSPPGKTANVRTIDGTPLSLAQLDWLEEKNVPLSRWSSHHATVASDEASIEALMSCSRVQNLKVKPVFPFAIHSPHMLSIANQFRAVASQWTLSAPRWPIFSSVYGRFIETSDELREEAIAGALTPIDWVQTLRSLCEVHDVGQLINVGPSNALTGRMFTDGGLKDVRIEDASTLIQLGEV